MPQGRPRWKDIAVSVALAVLVTRLVARDPAPPRTAPSPHPAPRPSASPERSPRFVRFIRRYAVAEIAALIGIPLAVVSLVYAALATRDTALQLESSNRQLEASIEQLRLAEQSAQPEFVLNGHLRQGGSAGRPARFDRLSLEMRGTARDVSARVETVFGLQTDNIELTYAITFFEWWRWAGAGIGEAASWTSNPRLLSGLDDREHEKSVILFSLIEVSYADIFGRYHTRYFSVLETLGKRPVQTVGPESAIVEAKDLSAAVRCHLELAAQRSREQGGTILAEGVVRKQTRLQAKLSRGKPIVLADLDASVGEDAPRDCYRLA
jgi:hypothetical protein